MYSSKKGEFTIRFCSYRAIVIFTQVNTVYVVTNKKCTSDNFTKNNKVINSSYPNTNRKEKAAMDDAKIT